MIGELQKRPQSKHIAMRPFTSKVNEANQKQSEQCFLMGKKHMAKKQYPEALRHYFNATIHNPLNYKAFCNMGTILKELGNFKEAKNTYIRALMAKPDDHISLYNFGNLNRISGDEDSAIPLYQKVIRLKEINKIELGSEYQNSLLNLGICFKNIGKFDEAIQCYSKFISLCPHEESGYFNKGMCYISKIKKINRNLYSKVHKLLCEQAQKLLGQAAQKNKNNLTTKTALIQIKYVNNPCLQEYNSAIHKFEKLTQQSKNASQDQLDNIRIKASYCAMEIKKIIAQNQKMAQKQKQEAIKDAIVQNTYDKEQNIKKQQIKQFNKSFYSQKSTKERIKSANRPQSKKSSQLNRSQEFTQFLDNGNYAEALEVANALPEGIQKYQKQILVNFLNGQQAKQEIFIRTAKQIYDNKIAQPIKKDSCSRDGHEICAAMLVQLHQYELATKHYEILMQILEQGKSKPDQNKIISEDNENEIERIRSQLGILYAQRLMYEPAIQEFKKNLEVHPNNYTTVSSLGLCLVQSGNKKQALKIYTEYIEKNFPNYKAGIEIKEDQKKVSYVDCLINIAICLEGQGENEIESLKRAKKEIQRFYPSYGQLENAFIDTNNHLGVYLRLAQIYQNQMVPFSQAKQLNQELLDCYLGCLDYPQCPDRNEILVNCGILFYLSGCYANAYLIYTRIHQKQISNDLGLTLAHLEQYEQSLIHLKQSNDKQPENIIYRTNFQIVKWICGLYKECLPNKLVQLYPCKCSHMMQARSIYGLALIDYLTQILSKYPQKTAKDPLQTVEEQTSSLINFLVDEFNKITTNNKYSFLTCYMNSHMKCFLVHKQNLEFKKIQKSVMMRVLQKKQNRQAYSKFFCESIEFLKTLPPSPYYSIYGQLIFYSSFLVNRQNNLTAYFQNRSSKEHCPLSHAIPSIPQKQSEDPRLQTQNQAMWAPIYRKYPILDDQKFYFQQIFTSDINSQQINNHIYETMIKFPNNQINIKNFGKWINDAESAIENDSQLLMDFIEETYYSCEGVLQPMRKQFRYPRCKDYLQCESCFIKSLRIFSTIVNKNMNEDSLQINKNNPFTNARKTMLQKFNQFSKQNLFKSDIYDRDNQKIKLEITPYSVPFILISHFQTFQQVSRFIKIISPSLNLVLHEGDRKSKGMRYFYVNRRIVLQVWWGQMCYDQTSKSKAEIDQCITYFDKFGAWWQNVVTAPATQAVLLLDQFLDLSELPEKFEWSEVDNQLVTDGIKLIRYLSEDGEEVYKKAKKELLKL